MMAAAVQPFGDRGIVVCRFSFSDGIEIKHAIHKQGKTKIRVTDNHLRVPAFMPWHAAATVSRVSCPFDDNGTTTAAGELALVEAILCASQLLEMIPPTSRGYIGPLCLFGNRIFRVIDLGRD
jgi:hypothetical protein